MFTRFGLAIAGLAIFADQISKWWIIAKVMNPPQAITITPFFNLVLAWNKGVSFSLFSSDAPYTKWVLLAIASTITVVLLMWLRKVEQRLLAAAIGLIIGGAIGNIIDRLRFGAVIDFLELHAGSFYWPAFNVADSAITVGVALMLYDGLFYKSQTKNYEV